MREEGTYKCRYCDKGCNKFGNTIEEEKCYDPRFVDKCAYFRYFVYLEETF